MKDFSLKIKNIKWWWWIGVVCAMGRQLTTYSYFAQNLKSCWCIHYLGFIGSCCVVLWNFWQVSQTGSTDSNLRCFGEWSLIVLCGSFGGKGIHVPLTRMKDRFMSWSFSFFKLCLIGQMLRVFLLLFLYLICLIFVLSLLLSFFPCSF